jgi:hypothetical protein
VRCFGTGLLFKVRKHTLPEKKSRWENQREKRRRRKTATNDAYELTLNNDMPDPIY